jgi:type II secretory pathway component GspD/PulD (secretin)
VFRVAGPLNAAFGILQRDNRFKVVTAPSLTTRPGVVATFASGAQVPVLGALTVPQQGGQPIQQIEYRDSGVILKVKATMAGHRIRLEVDQEISTFTRTDTGVVGSPTLQRRATSNAVTVESGELVALAGLTQDRSEAVRAGLLGGWLGTRRKEQATGEVVVFLQASVDP